MTRLLDRGDATEWQDWMRALLDTSGLPAQQHLGRAGLGVVPLRRHGVRG
jgi:hypothetical protein